jgi:hypothetical protein
MSPCFTYNLDPYSGGAGFESRGRDTGYPDRVFREFNNLPMQMQEQLLE